MIKKIFVLLVATLFCTAAFGEAASSIDGEGRFYAKNEDSLSFIKSQLLYSAFSDVISKELKYLGLDSAQFWKSYDEKFEKYFEPIKEQLQKKYGMDKNPPAAKRADYNKSHRLKRLSLKSKWGRLNRAVKSYSIKKMTRSPQIPNSRYINLNAKVDRSLLKKIYFQMISDSDAREIKTIFVSADFDINDLTWSDLGVELESDFTTVIKEHWKKWLSENLKTRFTSIELTDPAKEKELDAFLKAPREVIPEVNEENPEEPLPLNEFKDALWLKLNISLDKVKEDFLMKERAYQLTGDFILLDMNNGGVVHSHDILPSENKYSFEKGKPLSTNIATWVYRTASSEFASFDEKIASIPSQDKSVELLISGVESFLDFEKVGELLAIKGASQRFATKLISYEGSIGKLNLKYTGDKDALLKTLSELGEEKIDENRVLAKSPDESPFSFQLLATAAGKIEVDKTEENKNEKVSTEQ
ncbi:MAG: hypothetical protein CME70_03865 [Halobacteriovorax sp.]|nr:hypothetical protein [Halobacteriovorax sp.]|tara:strand:+ start:143529 stop:144944 length:1416 start_codon:yes stop_codon:yes gene_type:complete